MISSATFERKRANKRLLAEMKHECKLPQAEDMLVKYIDSGYFVDFRRKFRGWLMVSESNPRSKIYLKSSFAIRKEKEIHLQEYYYMIHPFSQMRYVWEVFMILILFVLLVMIPVQLSYKNKDHYVTVRLTFDIICIADIILTFNTGFQNMDTKKIVMARRKVCFNYLSSWFLLDLITSLNVEFLFAFFILPASQHPHVTSDPQWYMRIPIGLKILRIMTLLKYMNRYRDYKQLSLNKFKMIKMVLVFFLLLLWTTCFLYIVKQGTQKSAQDVNLLNCLYKITNLFFLISNSEDPSLAIMVFEMICLTVGVILQLFFYAQLLQTVSKYNTSKNKYHEMVQQLHDYMNTKDLPQRMIKRVIQYFDFRFQKNYFKEDEILGTLSQKLIEEINIHSCESLIANVDIFKNMPTSVVLKMTGMMKQEIFLPNDVIVRANTVGDSMYFISSGTVAIFTPSGKEVCHLTDGSNFGEVSLIMPHSTRVATVVAVDYCDLFSLSRKDFRTAIEPYPELYQRTVKIGQQRMRDIMHAEHLRNRPSEYYDFLTPEGIADFIEKLYEM